MAGIQNNMARIFNLKARDKDGSIVVVRLHPGLNVVDDESWSAVKGVKMCKRLQDEGAIVSGKKPEGGTESMSKKVLASKLRKTEQENQAAVKDNDALRAENEELKKRMAAVEKQMQEKDKG